MGALLEKYFVIVLLGSLGIGLLLPIFDGVPSWGLLVLLSILIFFSSFQITVREIRAINPGIVLLFYLARFIILPVILFLVSRSLLPVYATGIFLLSIMPSGAASPGIAHLYKGNISLSLLLVISSSLLAPFLIPVILLLFTGQDVSLDVPGLFLTLSLTIFLPVLIHLAFRQSRTVMLKMREYSSSAVILVVAALIMVIIGKQRTFLLENFSMVPGYLLSATATYLVFYLFGWFFSLRGDEQNRISYAVGSGVNNSALGIVLAFLYFSTQVSTFMVIAEIPWILLMTLFKTYLNTRKLP